MKELDKAVRDLFKEIMANCKAERLEDREFSLREMAKRIGKTENYVGAVENGRTFPSLKTFLKYLLINRFDTSPLTQLRRTAGTSEKKRGTVKKQIQSLQNLRSDQWDLLSDIMDLDEKQIGFLQEQVRVVRLLKIRALKKK